MEINNVIIAIILVLICLIPSILIFFAVFFWLPKKKGDSARKEFTDYAKALLERGITSPADVLSVAHLGHTRKLGGGTQERELLYTVEVHPDGRASFQTKLQTWLPTWRYQSSQWMALQKQDEEAKRIWVTYDPSQMIIHHFDYEHEKIIAEKDGVQRRNTFIDLESESLAIRETGEEALATILEIEDLNVATKEEKKEGSSMRLKLNVSPKTGDPFVAETYGMIANESIPKLTVGKKVYVKYDVHNPAKAALIRSTE